MHINCVCCESKIMDDDFRVKCLRCERSICKSCSNKEEWCIKVGPCAERRLRVAPPVVVNNSLRLKDVAIGGALAGLVILCGFFISQPTPIVVQPAEVASVDDSRVIHLPVRQFVRMSDLKFSIPVIFRDGANAEMFISMAYRLDCSLTDSEKRFFDHDMTERVRMSAWFSCRRMTSTEFITDKRDMILHDFLSRRSSMSDFICKFNIPLIRYSVREDLMITEQPRVMSRVNESAEADVARPLKNRY